MALPHDEGQRQRMALDHEGQRQRMALDHDEG